MAQATGRDPEIAGDLLQRSLATTRHSDQVITKLLRIRLGHDRHPSKRGRSLTHQVSTKPWADPPDRRRCARQAADRLGLPRRATSTAAASLVNAGAESAIFSAAARSRGSNRQAYGVDTSRTRLRRNCSTPDHRGRPRLRGTHSKWPAGPANQLKPNHRYIRRS